MRTATRRCKGAPGLLPVGLLSLSLSLTHTHARPRMPYSIRRLHMPLGFSRDRSRDAFRCSRGGLHPRIRLPCVCVYRTATARQPPMVMLCVGQPAKRAKGVAPRCKNFSSAEDATNAERAARVIDQFFTSVIICCVLCEHDHEPWTRPWSTWLVIIYRVYTGGLLGDFVCVFFLSIVVRTVLQGVASKPRMAFTDTSG